MDASNIAKGIWDSIKGLPQSVYYGAKRTYISTGAVGYDRKLRNERETERFYQVVKSLVRNEEPLRRLVTTVITEFYRKLDDEGKQTIHNQLAYGAGRFSGRLGGQIFVSQTVAMAIIRNSRSSYAYKALYRFGASFTISTALWQGLIEEAALGSRRLQNHYNAMYWKVQPQGLDMIYFVVEDQLKPYLDFIISHPQTCKGINNEICKLAG
ncbi:hypothetical protein FJP62_03620 [Pantoea vagans]|uniref:hypothetical protein n=1 Tax=Pantoea anthophila TaxID=470931 RepID=UPI00111EBC97|nr:hypothetical protein [Pantoea anthophila]MDQ1211455.1 hypothetical protein [Pantoea anthophila]TPE19151.1 hypothetical protein FJP62_03620 [Pantoea vagans]